MPDEFVTFDLGIEDGTVVTGAGRAPGHVYVLGGSIAAISTMRLRARERVDASDLLVMPGMVDTHVHLMDPGDPSREDFPSGTAAAAGAGVTTIIEHTHSNPVTNERQLSDKRRYLASRSRVDFALAAHALRDNLGDIPGLWAAGAAFFKVFTCTTHGILGLEPMQLRRLFDRVAEVGAVCLVHAEDEAITATMERRLRSAGRTDGGVIPEWRSRAAEISALVAVSRLAEETGARIVTAHLSHPDAVRVAVEASRSGGPILRETCPQYLTLLANEVLALGPLRKFTPPARAEDARGLAEMWELVRTGEISHISSDHAPSTQAQKSQGTIWDAPFGLPGLDTTLGLLLDAAAKGLISYERLVECYSEAPARAYGLAPRKGSMEIGADADLVIVDPAAAWVVDKTTLRSRAGWSPYEGRHLQGRAIQTYVRGTLVAAGDWVAEPGHGQFVPGAGWLDRPAWTGSP